MARFSFACLTLAAASIAMLTGQSARADDILRLDPALDRLIPAHASVEKLGDGFHMVEGPVWMHDGYLLFSDVPNVIRKWTPDAGFSVFREGIFAGPSPSGVRVGTNGLTLDPQGRLIACEHGNRRITRIEKDGSLKVLASGYQGKRLNSPNDLASRRNGDVYFTDPNYFAGNNPDSLKQFQPDLNFNGVYRVTSAGKLDLLTTDVPYPNGLAFSPDEKKLYVANTKPKKLWIVFDVKPDGSLANRKVLFDAAKETGDGVPDGLKVDSLGNIWATGPGGILIISPAGKHLGTIRIPEIGSNCAWGDADGKTLYITARTGLYRIRLNVAGIRP